jgi:hypothetical protein
MLECQPNPELMLDSKTHSGNLASRAATTFELTFPGICSGSSGKIANQLSIFPTATLIFVILILEKICNAVGLFDQQNQDENSR